MNNVLKKIKRILWRTTKAMVTMFFLPLTFFVIGCSPVLSIILTICFLKVYKKIRNNKFTLNLKIIPVSESSATSLCESNAASVCESIYKGNLYGSYHYNYGSDYETK